MANQQKYPVFEKGGLKKNMPFGKLILISCVFTPPLWILMNEFLFAENPTLLEKVVGSIFGLIGMGLFFVGCISLYALINKR